MKLRMTFQPFGSDTPIIVGEGWVGGQINSGDLLFSVSNAEAGYEHEVEPTDPVPFYALDGVTVLGFHPQLPPAGVFRIEEVPAEPEPEPLPVVWDKPLLHAYAADLRWQKEVGGIVVGGMAIETTDRTKGLANGAHAMAQANPDFTTQWRVSEGVFVTINAAQITAIALALGQHVADCFALEATVAAAIEAGDIVDGAGVEAAFSA